MCATVNHPLKMAANTVLCGDNPTACGDCQTIAKHWPNVSNVTNVEPIYLAQAIIYSVELPVSIVGLILNIVFICRKKTNFLVRVFVYTSIPITLFLVVFWFVNIPAFNPDQLVRICLYFHEKQFVPMFWTSILILSFCISIILITTLCNHTFECECCPRRYARMNPSTLRHVCLIILEVLFVTSTVAGPVLVSLSMFALSIGRAVSPSTQLNFDIVSFILTITENKGEATIVLSYFFAIPLTVIIISVVALLVEFYTLCKQIARRGRATVIKEMVIFVVHLVVTIVSSIAFILSITRSIVVHIMQTVLLTLMSLFPLVVFVYMRCSFHTFPREDRRAGNLNRRDLQTAGLRTNPPSTRVSLPSDTGAHAPNFLSPSTAEPTDVTPLLSN